MDATVTTPEEEASEPQQQVEHLEEPSSGGRQESDHSSSNNGKTASTLSAAEKKTIEFGLAVAILSSCPSQVGPSAAAEGCTKQRASKHLRLWQGACLGGLANAGSRARPNPEATNQRRQEREAASVEGRFDNFRAAVSADFPHLGRDRTGWCGVVPAGSFVSPAAGPVQGLLASNDASDLRALEVVALSGCQSEGAKAVQKEALDRLWHGDCSPDMVSLFAKEMLEQVVLRGQGGCGQVYRHVLDLMVSITADVAAAASLAYRENTGAAAAATAAAAASTLSRRFAVAVAVSQALDATLVQLARELRRDPGSGGTVRSRRQQQSPFAAMARAAGAGLYLDAYEAAVAFLLRAFNCLAEEGPEEERRTSLPSPSPRGAERRGRKWPPDESFGARGQWQGQRQGQGTPTGQTTGTTAAVSERLVERGVLPRGWDAGDRRNAWAQRKLEVLAEATTAMSSFRMGQLRLQRIVARVYGWAGSS